MPEAEKQRLMGALQDFIASYGGDGGGGPRSGVDPKAVADVQAAQALLEQLGAESETPEETPGRRAAAAGPEAML